MDGLDKVDLQEEATPGSHRARENVRPPLAPTGRAHQWARVNSPVGLRLDTLGTFSILSGGSSSTGGFSGEQHRDVPESGSLVTGHGDHDAILGLSEGKDESDHETSEEAVRTVCEQAARNILSAELRRGLQAMLRKELRGGLQAALREEVGRAVREEFQTCFQELRELRPQRILVESGCQADATAAPVQLRRPHAKSDGSILWPTRASFPQPQKSSWPRQLVTSDPWARTVTTASSGQRPGLPGPGDAASRGRQLIVPKHEVEAHHRTGCGDSFASMAVEEKSMAEEEKSVKPARQSHHLREARELLWQHGLLKYATTPKRSVSSPEDRTRPMPRQGSGSCCSGACQTGLASGACQTGADPGGGADAKHPARLSKKDFSELGSFERALAGEFLSNDGSPSFSPEQAHALAGKEGCQRPGLEEQDALLRSMTEEAGRAEAGSEGGGWDELEAELRPPTAEMPWTQMDKELVSQWSSDYGDGELESVTSTHPRAESGRCSRLAALPAYISRVAPACGIVPWDQAYPWASSFYQWIIFGLVGTGLYYTGSRTYQEWKLGESSRALLLALDTIMGMGALAGILSCGVLWRSRRILDGCRLVMAYLGKRGMLALWEEVNATELVCTLSLWLAAVLAAAAEALYFEQSAASEELRWHVCCFALFAFVLMGMSQFALHLCRCITGMIDTFCYGLSLRPDFPKALKEWSLLQALCRSVCTSIQSAFVSLQATVAAVVLLSIQELGRHEVSHLVALVPGLIVAMGVFRTSLWAAAVTDKCNRVPMLVNSVQVDDLLNQDRMHVVHYIAYSQAGFYVFDLRLTSSAVLKTAYIVCAVTFFLATRVFVE